MASESNTLPTKRQLIAALEDLPDDATFVDVLERLHFVQNVQVGLAQANQGMLIPHEQGQEKPERMASIAWTPKAGFSFGMTVLDSLIRRTVKFVPGHLAWTDQTVKLF